jgi:hypothetical protein
MRPNPNEGGAKPVSTMVASSIHGVKKPELLNIWGGGSKEARPSYSPAGKKPAGSAIGFIAEENGTPTRYLAKSGIPQDAQKIEALTTRRDMHYRSYRTVLEEFCAAQLYTVLGEGNNGFYVPTHRLAMMDVINAQTKDHELAKALMEEVNQRRRPEDHITQGLHLLSYWMDEYRDLSNLLECYVDNNDQAPRSFEDWLASGQVPDYANIDGKRLPIVGLMELLAASRLLSDPDVLGGGAKNTGFVVERDQDKNPIALRVVKIDAGEAFSFGEAHNRFDQSLNPRSRNPKLSDKKDLQFGNQAKTNILWAQLSKTQQNRFLRALLRGIEILTQEGFMDFIIQRDGAFDEITPGIALLPKPYVDTLIAQCLGNVNDQCDAEVYGVELSELPEDDIPATLVPFNPDAIGAASYLCPQAHPLVAPKPVSYNNKVFAQHTFAQAMSAISRKPIEGGSALVNIWNRNSDGTPKTYTPVAKKTEGTTVGFIVEQDTPEKYQYLAKSGTYPNATVSNRNIASGLRASYCRLPIDIIQELVGAQMYALLGNGVFYVPEHYLAILDVINQYTKENELALCLMREANQGRAQDKQITQGLHLLSRWIDGYQILAKLEGCYLNESDTTPKLFLACIKDGFVPEYAEIDGQRVPILGLMELLAASRLLSDVDVFGNKATKAGFVVERNAEGIPIAVRVVKPDADRAFTFEEHNQFSQYFNKRSLRPKLVDPRDLQFGAFQSAVIKWNNLTKPQQQSFLVALQAGHKTLHNDNLLNYMITRCGDFENALSSITNLPPEDLVVVDFKTGLSPENVAALNLVWGLYRGDQLIDEVYGPLLKDLPEAKPSEALVPFNPELFGAASCTFAQANQLAAETLNIQLPPQDVDQGGGGSKEEAVAAAPAGPANRNREPSLARVWGGKHLPTGQFPHYQPVAQIPGSLLGFIAQELKPDATGQRYKAMPGFPKMPTEQFTVQEARHYRPYPSIMREFLAAQLYAMLGNLKDDGFHVSKHRLAIMPVLHEQTKDNPLARALLQELNAKHKPEDRITETLHLLSRMIDGYQHLANLEACYLDESDQEPKTFLNCLLAGKVPECATIEGQRVPILGLMELLAASRLLSDVDVFGDKARNAGFVVERNAEGIPIAVRVVKPDADKAFNFEDYNLFTRYFNKRSLRPKLVDPRDLQFGAFQSAVIKWNNLTEPQRQRFLVALQAGYTNLQNDAVVDFMMTRGGALNTQRLKANLAKPERIASFKQEWRGYMGDHFFEKNPDGSYKPAVYGICLPEFAESVAQTLSAQEAALSTPRP